MSLDHANYSEDTMGNCEVAMATSTEAYEAAKAAIEGGAKVSEEA